MTNVNTISNRLSNRDYNILYLLLDNAKDNRLLLHYII
nr:MAG TPA: hypothetical protein [Caudoviricetes sp.]